VIDENPDIKFGEVGKKLGELWKGLSEQERQPYEQQAEEDKQRYQNDMEGYVPDPSYDTKGKRKDPNKPKRAMSAYLYFCKAHRDAVKAQHPDKGMTEVQKVLGDQWKATTEEEREPFVHQAKVDRERYDNEMLKLAQKNSGYDSE